MISSDDSSSNTITYFYSSNNNLFDCSLPVFHTINFAPNMIVTVIESNSTQVQPLVQGSLLVIHNLFSTSYPLHQFLSYTSCAFDHISLSQHICPR